MNAILYNVNNTVNITENDVFKEAEKIIKTTNEFSVNNKKPKRSKLIIITICLIVFILLITIFSTIFALLNINNNKIISGISILGINVSNLTKEEAQSAVNEALNSRLNSNLVFSHNDQLYNVLPSQLECSYDVASAVDEAYSYGRTGNVFQNNFNILNTLLNKVNINPTLSYNKDLLTSIIEQMNSSFNDSLKEYSYTIEENNLIITPGKSGNVIVADKLESMIVDKLTSLEYNSNAIEVPVEAKDPDNIDIDKIHSEIYKEPVDAYYTKDPFAVFPSSTGLDFKISVDEAKAMLNTPSETYTIPLKTLYPNVTTDQIGTEAFPDLLSSYSTVTWLLPSGNNSELGSLRLTSDSFLVSRCARLIGSGISSSVSSQA